MAAPKFDCASGLSH